MSDENDGEEREYGPEDFDQHPVEVEVHLPPEAWNEATERYHAAQKKGDDADLMDFVKDLIEIQYDWKIIDEESDEPPAETAENGEQWEEAGRALFNWVYAQVRDDVINALDQFSWKVEQGEPISESDVEYLRDALENVEFIAQQAATVSPETEPVADWTEVLGDEAVQEYARHVQEDDGE